MFGGVFYCRCKHFANRRLQLHPRPALRLLPRQSPWPPFLGVLAKDGCKCLALTGWTNGLAVLEQPSDAPLAAARRHAYGVRHAGECSLSPRPRTSFILA